MAAAAVFIGLGLVLVAVVLVWAFRSGWKPAEPTCDMGNAAGAGEAVLPPLYLMESIFAAEDFDFVFASAPRHVQRLFLQERKSLALLWLRETRGKVRDAFVLYRRVARAHARLQFSVEGRMAVKYLAIEILSVFLAGLVWLWGPFGARRMVGYTAALAEELAVLVASVSVQLGSYQLGPSPGATTSGCRPI